MLANHRIEIYCNRKLTSGNSDSSAIYPSLHNRYIAFVYPKYCDYKGENFPQRTFSLKTGNLFSLTFYVK